MAMAVTDSTASRQTSPSPQSAEQLALDIERAKILRESKHRDKKTLPVNTAKLVRQIDRAAGYQNIAREGMSAYERGELSIPRTAQLVLRAERLRRKNLEEDEDESENEYSFDQTTEDEIGRDDTDSRQKKNKKEQYHSYTSPFESIGKTLRGGREIGLVSRIMLLFLAAMGLFIDTLPLVTGDLSSILDWTLDIGFYFFFIIVTIVVKQQVVRAIFGMRGILNITQTILEAIPAVDTLPWHSIAVMVLYLDAKYNIVFLGRIWNLGAARLGYKSAMIKK